MKFTPNPPAPALPRSTAPPVCCDVAGHGAVRATPEGVRALHQRAEPPAGEPLSASFLKHLDEQTLVGLAAVFQAVRDHGLAPELRFTDWGILAAPHFFGRAAMAVALHRFQLEGAWGISPHLIPHHSLHSAAGTVSQVLQVHGPNFGVSGSAHAADEGFLTAAAMLAGDRVPGVWLVLTGYEPEFLPEQPDAPPALGPPGPAALCCAAAFALVAARPGSCRLRLHVHAGPVAEDAAGGALPGFRLGSLLDALTRTPPAGAWCLHCGGAVELKRLAAGAEICS